MVISIEIKGNFYSNSTKSIELKIIFIKKFILNKTIIIN